MELSQITFSFDDDAGKKEEKKKMLDKISSSGAGKIISGKIKSPRGRKPLKDTANADAIEIPEDEILFKKLSTKSKP